MFIVMLMTEARQRRDAIRDLLSSSEFSSQMELGEALEELGFPASQPVLSRDLRALDVAKRDGVYQVLDEERVTPLESLRSLLRGVADASHLAVVHCEPGAASAVARALEAEELPGLVGTVAGDDTILCALGSARDRRFLERRIGELL